MSIKLRMALLYIMAAMFIIPTTARADTGPKPSIHIAFENMESEQCYATLLSKTDSTGPYSAFNGDEAEACNSGIDPEVWKAFAEYRDADGYYFLNEIWLCSETERLDWTYFPPYSFKLLVYYPRSNTFFVSEKCERYAFDSYFTADMKGTGDLDAVQDGAISGIAMRKSYDYAGELIALSVRIIITILIEIGVALLFGFRQGTLLKLILIVNVITQVLLNILVNIVDYSMGSFMMMFTYIGLELLVFVAESVAYSILFNRRSPSGISKVKTIAYSFAANAASFVAGFFIALRVSMFF